MTKHFSIASLAALCVTLSTVTVFCQSYYIYSPRPAAPEEEKSVTDGVLVRDVPVKKGDTLFGISRTFSGHGDYYPQILLFNNIKDPDLIYAGDTIKVPVSKNGDQHSLKTHRSSAAQRKKTSVAAHKAERKIKNAKNDMHSAKPTAHAVQTVKSKSSGASPQQAQSLLELPLSDLKQLDDNREKDQDRKSAKTSGRPPLQASIPSKRRTRQPVMTNEISPQTQKAVLQDTKPAPEITKAAGETATEQRLFEKGIKAYRQEDCRTALELFDRFMASYPSSRLAADVSLYRAECYLKLSGQ